MPVQPVIASSRETVSKLMQVKSPFIEIGECLVFERIEMLNMARALTGHAAQRNTVVARNIANADTPGYKAGDLEPFEKTYRRASAPGLRVTRVGHMETPAFSPADAREIVTGEVPSPNGNSVSLEEELVKTAQLKREHDLSLGIYRSALDLMRLSLGKRV